MLILFGDKEAKGKVNKQTEEPMEKQGPFEKLKFVKPKKDIGEMVREMGLPKLALVMACGVVIILLSVPGLFSSTDNNSGGSEDLIGQTEANSKIYSTTEEYTSYIENKLKQILMKVNDIGKVEVMVTLNSSIEDVPLKDETIDAQTTKEQDSAGGSRESNSSNKKEETIFDGSDEGNSKPYIIKQLEPEIRGIVVAAEGGDQPKIQTEIVEAVMVLFDIPANKIKVMKLN